MPRPKARRPEPKARNAKGPASGFTFKEHFGKRVTGEPFKRHGASHFENMTRLKKEMPALEMRAARAAQAAPGLRAELAEAGRGYGGADELRAMRETQKPLEKLHDAEARLKVERKKIPYSWSEYHRAPLSTLQNRHATQSELLRTEERHIREINANLKNFRHVPELLPVMETRLREIENKAVDRRTELKELEHVANYRLQRMRHAANKGAQRVRRRTA